MKKLIKRLSDLGYNLTTLEQHDNKIHFMHRQHLVVIEQVKDGYQLDINRPKSRFGKTCSNEHRLVVGIADYFC